MNSYKLNNKDEDKKFLEGGYLVGSAMFLKDEFNQHVINKDDKIVIILSNGKKYMGKVVRFTSRTKGDIVEGTLEFIRI